MKTKKNLHTAAAHKMFAVIILLGVTMFTPAFAQPTIVLPFNMDNFVGHPGYPNSSTIDYSNFWITPAPQLTAMVSDPGAPFPAPLLYLNDHNLVPWSAVILPAPAAPGCSPDVIIGDDAANPGNYLIGVVATVSCGIGNDVYLFIYKVGGGAPFAAPPAFVNMYNISGTCNAVGPAHIDVIDEYSTPIGGPALPIANKFVITWQDATQGIMGYFANLNAPATGVPTVINSNLSLSSPDVAAIERAGTCGFEDWALFTYVDHTGFPNKLYYQEWKITPTSAIMMPILYDNTLNYISYGALVSLVRIDAIDDYNFNTPGGGNATFDIVTSAAATTGAIVVQYNDIIGPLPPVAAIDISTPVFSAYGPEKAVVPQVTCGPGAFYTVGYHAYGAVPPAYYASAVDWGTGTTTTTANAYQVNTTPWGPVPGYPFGICVSASSNIDVCPTQEIFTGFENVGALWEKYGTPICVPYSFKPVTKKASSVNTWQVSPNPVVDNVSLIAPDGFTGDDGTTYSITDLTGKSLLQNKVSGSIEDVNVKNLPAGMYMVNINSKDGTTKAIKFVKE